MPAHDTTSGRFLKDPRPLDERFWSNVDKSGDCWMWTAYRSASGYGRFTVRHGVPTFAHRTAWELTYGQIPDGLLVCHRCDNPPCVRPAHLFLGTASDNVRDKCEKGRSRGGVGERAHAAKLTETQIRAIRDEYAGGELQRDIGRRYGVHQATISDIITGEGWKHVH